MRWPTATGAGSAAAVADAAACADAAGASIASRPVANIADIADIADIAARERAMARSDPPERQEPGSGSARQRLSGSSLLKPGNLAKQLRAFRALLDGATAADAIVSAQLTHPQDIAYIQSIAVDAAARGGARADFETMTRALSAQVDGLTPEQTIATHGLSHPADIAEVRAAEARFGDHASVVGRIRALEMVLGGETVERAVAAHDVRDRQEIAEIALAVARFDRRATLGTRLKALQTIFEGASVERALATHDLTHAEDLAEIRTFAADRQYRRGPHAPRPAKTTAPQDTRTREEIARTAALHRPAQRRGLADLRAIRLRLGESPGTLKQRRRGSAYGTRLANLELTLRACLRRLLGDDDDAAALCGTVSDGRLRCSTDHEARRATPVRDRLRHRARERQWDALRDAARRIQDDATGDHEAGRITGMDYLSITEHMAIVFRCVPDQED